MKSFDLYDTLITRDVLKPTDLFYFIGKEAYKQLIIPFDAAAFQKYRISAELTARKRSLHEEVTLDEIYKCFIRLLKTPQSLSKAQLMQLISLELTFEINSYSAIEENLKKIEKNSIIITDIYHSYSFIKEVLKGLHIEYYKLYISSEYKKMKRYGSLYDIVLQHHKIDFHLGDNVLSDYKIPLSKEIKAYLYTSSQANRYEELVYNSCAPYEYRAILSGVMKASRLKDSYENTHQQIVHSVASSVAAPLLFSYVSWILIEANKQSLDIVYFVARDGQILYELALIINEYLNYDIELKYLYGSRKAWHLPAVTEINEAVLDWVFDSVNLSLADVFLRLELSAEKFIPLLKIEPSDLNRPLRVEEVKKIKSIFLHNKSIHHMIMKSASYHRTKAIEYLERVGFSQDKKIAIADVGWRGRQQRSLSKLLWLGGLYPKKGLVGFYLGLVDPVTPLDKDNFFSFFKEPDSLFIAKYTALIEVFVAARHGSCIGYDTDDNGAVQPVLREQVNNKMISWGLNIHQKAVLNFSKTMLQVLSKYKVNIFVDKTMVHDILKLYMETPLFEESKAMSKAPCYDDQEEKKTIVLSSFINYRQTLIALFYKHNKCNGYWLEGNLAMSYHGLLKNLLYSLLKIRRKIGAYLR